MNNLPRGLNTLNLQANRLKGTLSPTLKFPPKLQKLDLSFNFLHGTFPADLQLPDSVEYLMLVGFPVNTQLLATTLC